MQSPKIRQGHPWYHGQRATDIPKCARISVMARIMREGYQWVHGYPGGYPYGRSTDRSIRVS